MKKTLKTIGWCFLGLFIIYTFYVLWQQSLPAPEIYEIIAPAQRNIIKSTIATGSLESRTQIELKPQITGVITEISTEAGKTIHKGDIVAMIRVIPDMSQLTQAQSKVESSRINLEEVERVSARTQSLYEKGVVSREENEHQQNSLAAAKEQLNAAISQVEVIKKGSSQRAGDINTSEVRSTMNGIVLNVPVKIGTSVSGSSAFSQGTTIATIADMNDIIFHGYIDETEVAKLHIGMNVQLTPGSMQNVSIPAVLDYIAPECVMQNGAKMFELKASASVPDNIEIRSGYSVNANIALAEAFNVISVDETCIEFEGDNTYVYCLISDEKDVKNQHWEKRPVELGISDGMYVEIKSGINMNDRMRGIQK